MKMICCLAILLSSCVSLGQTYKVLWSFGSVPNDGSGSFGNLIFDSAGNLYGTTQGGGLNNGGTVFQLSPRGDGTWAESVLYNFCSVIQNGTCSDGQWPEAGLTLDGNGNLYGTTFNGGNGTGPCAGPCGTVFELMPANGVWTEMVLYSFCDANKCQDGSRPTSQLIFDSRGNLYGTTSEGGTGKYLGGTVFELSPGANGWTHTNLYNFCVGGQQRICPDGDKPEAGVTLDRLGNLYGTTSAGGTSKSKGAGTLFELSPSVNGWNLTTLLAFNPTDGQLQVPLGTVSFDLEGNLYSTASAGSSGVFRLLSKSHRQQNFIFDITDGYGPTSGLIEDPSDRAFFGTTAGGGSEMGGVAYQITKSGQETVLYNFCEQSQCIDGRYPYAGLVEDESGNLYGTATQGGTNGDGVVFEIIP